MSEFQTPSAPTSPATQSASPRGNGFGIAALILGIVTIVGFAIPFFNYVTIGTGAIGTVLAIVGLVVKDRKRGTSIAGLILSVLGGILSVVLVVVYAAIFFGISQSVADSSAAAEAEHTVTYTVTGDAATADISYSTYSSSGASGTSSANGTKLPFEKKITVKGSSESFDFNLFSLTAMSDVDGGSVTCEIKIDGDVVSTNEANGSFALASCSGTN
jgi:hypothetical protein